MKSSRISGFYKLSVAARIAELQKLGWLSARAAQSLTSGNATVAVAAADKMIENVVGVFGLPLAIAPNFIVNEREYMVPLVVEEPSIVAALSNAAAMARPTGGFSALLEESLLIGQIHVVGLADVRAAVRALTAADAETLAAANAVHPRLAARGGGVRAVEYRELQLPDGAPLLAVHLLVDTADAMGANLVNSICETIAPRIAALSGGEVALRILSNLADRSVVTARVRYDCDALKTGDMSGNEVRDRIVLASAIAEVDPYRAATHNKGVMNGVDALALATGNDWRAIEAGAHADAVRDGHYSAMTRWSVGRDGGLNGELRMPLKTGVVGGTLASNPGAALGLAIAGVESSRQLSELMAAVGLAQNFAALRALASSGIQQGHMRLHARSLATAAGAADELLDEVVEDLVESGDIKAWKAAEIVAQRTVAASAEDDFAATSAGKVILFGEHAVVYGRHALAVPIHDAVRARATTCGSETTLNVREWRLSRVIDGAGNNAIDALVQKILTRLDVANRHFRIDVSSALPAGMGLGASAALAVAVTRAIADCLDVDLDDAAVNDIAYDCEKLAHGTPSGIDNTISVYGVPLLFRHREGFEFTPLELAEVPPLIIGFSHQPGATHDQVAGVRARRERSGTHYESVFDQIDALCLQAAELLQTQQFEELGLRMNVCQGLLNALQVSTPELEQMIDIARNHGATGAKLTGAGGGGSIVALCPGTEDAVTAALQEAGYKTFKLTGSGGRTS